MKLLHWVLPALLALIPLRLAAQKPLPTDTLLTRILQPIEMQDDFRYLRRLLEETHPGLYRYVPKANMQAKLDSIDRTLTQPLPFYDFYRIVAALIADIRCAHTYALPTKNWQRAFASNWKTLPFFMCPIQNRSYVLFNGTTDQTIKPGFELLAINGRTMASIRETMFRYYWTDGYVQSSKEAALQGQLFVLFYYWFIEKPDTYRLTFKGLTNDTIQIDIPAQPFSQALKMMEKNPVNKQMMAWYNRKKPAHPWRLSFPTDVAQTAYLRFDSFGGEKANDAETAAARFRTFMDKSLAEIQKKQIQHLIVDVRSNPGGWDVQGVELFTYLMKSDTAMRYYTRHHTVTDSSDFLRFSDVPAQELKKIKQQLIAETDGTFTVKADDDSWELRPQAPKPNQFKGKVYILMDGKSASTTSEFLAVAHANRIGTFVGEESCGVYEGGNGGSFINLSLPRSGILVNTPLVYYTNAVGKPGQPGRGTLPDHHVPITLDDLLQHTDGQLDFVKELIRKKTFR
ncbi:S41 family peptidase [Fibrella aquatica]|uniref:S41 family peptidase n=1 Tax=Fibrella aquatica TaxID=3242487 RepID=UPI0035230652